MILSDTVFVISQKEYTENTQLYTEDKVSAVQFYVIFAVYISAVFRQWNL
jgi:hypothetical protein